jgi:hypothetical protein
MSRHPKIYAATNDAATKRPFVLLDGTVEAAQSYVDAITTSTWWRDHCKPSFNGEVPTKVFVQFTEDTGWGAGILYNEDEGERHYYEGKHVPTMKIGKEPSNADVPAVADVWVLLHELAHVWEYEDFHGKPFIYAFAKLVNRFLGIKYHEELVQSMRHHKVRLNYRSIHGNTDHREGPRPSPR